MALGQLESALAEMERHCAALSIALVQGEPGALEQVSAALKPLAANFSNLLRSQKEEQLSNPTIKRRIVAIRDVMSDQRINLIRRSASIESSLNALMPDNRSTTYAAQSSRYGSSGRQTGAFKVLAA